MDFVIEIHLVMPLRRGNLTDSGIFQNCPGQCRVNLGLLGELAVLYLLESSGCSPRGPCTPHRSGIFPGMTLKSGAKYHLAGTDRVTGEEEPAACEMGVTRGS